MESMKLFHAIYFAAFQVLICLILLVRYKQFQSVKIIGGYTKPCNSKIDVHLDSIHSKKDEEKIVMEKSTYHDLEREHSNLFHLKSKDSNGNGNTDYKNETSNSDHRIDNHGNGLSQLIASHVKMLAIQNIAKEFAENSCANQLVDDPEAQKSTIVNTEEAMLLGIQNITLGVQQMNSYKLANSIPPSEARNILIVTRGRSGSSFLGSLIAQHPGTFYSSEPLSWNRINEIRNSKRKTIRQINLLKEVLNCVPEKEYIEYPRSFNKLLYDNFRLHKHCDAILKNGEACFMPEVYYSVCPIFPIRLIKTIKLPFKEAEVLLRDADIGKTLKVIYLFRDQRGVLQSMKSKVHWCKDSGRCKASNFCKQSQTDITSALILKKRYPDRVYIVRYEDICLKTSEVASDLFKFLDLSESELVDEYIRTHTHRNGDLNERLRNANTKFGAWMDKIETAYSTDRNTDSQAFEWRSHIDVSDVLEIQKECSVPMKTLGYTLMKNVSVNLHDDDYILMDPKPMELS